MRRLAAELSKAAAGVALFGAVVWVSFSAGAWLQEQGVPLAYRAAVGAETVMQLGADLREAVVGAGPRSLESDALTLTVARDGPRGPLLTVTEGTQALLIDREGRIAHRWDAHHERVFPDSAVPDAAVTWREPVLMPDGDLVAVHRRRRLLRPIGLLDQHRGLGVARIRPDGTARWATPLRAHHVPARTRDGGILVLWRRPLKAPHPAFSGLDRPVFDEGLARLDPATGAVTRRASFLDLFAGSGLGNLLTHPPAPRDGARSKGELFHSNTVRPVSPRAARHAPFAEAGDLVVSFRNLCAAALLDAGTWKVKTVLRGPWIVQHDVGVTPEGTVAAFDNLAPGGGSRVVRWDPATGRITRTFGDDVLDSPYRGARQYLPGGGTLAVDAWGNTAVAYTADGRVRWRLTHATDGIFLNSTRRVPRAPVARLLDSETPRQEDETS
mgnify:CR=1 FL=1